ncbi:MAG: hypothetical protein WD577_12160 [Bacteroidales bacterium]
MNRISIAIIVFFVIVVSGCDEQEYETSCFPERITRKVSGAIKLNSVIADYKYEGDKLERIVWSNSQTHFNSYSEDGKLTKVARKNIQNFQKLESRITHDHVLPIRTDEYRMRLDQFTHEDIDTVHLGYREFEYDGDKLVAERVFAKVDDSNRMELTLYKEYEYDLSGNMLKHVSFDDFQGDTIEAFSYVYDNRKHPFSSIDLLFEGETHVNNILTKTDLLSGVVYSYKNVYAYSSFPEQIIIEQENILTEVVSIVYTCK